MLDIRLDTAPGAAPYHRQIADQIAYQICGGELLAPARLPPTRDLARQLGLSRGVVVQAYEELCGRGLCVAKVGRGTEVAPGAATKPAIRRPLPALEPLTVPDEPISVDPGQLSLAPSVADTGHLPVSELRGGFSRILRYPSRLTAFGESAGDPTLRRLLCEQWLPRRGIDARPEEVLIVPGTQYGSTLIALLLIRTRSTLHFGVPGYLDIARNFARFGFQWRPHPVDGQGMIFPSQSLGLTDVAYLMPAHHFPQGGELSDGRRSIVVRSIRENGLLLIEDDYDSEFYYDRHPRSALKASAASDGIIYMGTFSKTLFNSLRLGYVVAHRDMVRELAALHWNLSRGTSLVTQQWVAELLASGTLDAHVKRMRSVYRRKRDRIVEILKRDFPGWSFDIPAGGLQFFIDLDDGISADEIIRICEAHKTKVADPRNYIIGDRDAPKFFVFGFGAASIDEIETMLKRLRHELDRKPVVESRNP